MSAKKQRPAIITRSRLVKDLKGLGLRSGQMVMLHVSVKSIGWIVGGPDVVIQAILDVLGPKGTLMMYVCWEGDTYLLDQWPREKRAAYLLECPPFDPARSRAFREWSILTEYLRTWPGAYRSSNPEASMAAVGAKAKWLTKGHPLNYGCGPGSPLEKLYQSAGKVLLLGASLDTITLLHYAEHMADLPDKKIVRYKVPLKRKGRRVWLEVEEFNTDSGIVEGADGGEYFPKIARQFIKSSRGRSGKVGMAKSYLFDAKSLVDVGVKWMEKNFS